MSRVPLLLGLALSIGCSSGGTPADAGADLLAPPDLTPAPPDLVTLDPGIISKSSASLAEAETHVAVAKNGFVAVAWIDLAQSGTFNAYRFSRDSGGTFEPIQRVRPAGGRESGDPVLAVDSQDNFYFAWLDFLRDQQGAAYDTHILVARAPAGTTKLDPPVDVTGDAQGLGDYDKPWITVTSDDDILVTYAPIARSALEVARSTDQGKTWSRALLAGGLFQNLAFPCDSGAGAHTYTVFFDGTGITLHWSDDRGVTWPGGNATIVDDRNGIPVAFDDPTCVADGDDVWISYGVSNMPPTPDGESALEGIVVAHSADGGRTIDFRTDAHDAAAGPLYLHPYLVRETGGPLHLLYYAGPFQGSPMGSLRRTISVDGALTFQPSEALHSPIFYSFDRSVRWLGDYLGAAWSDGSLYVSYTDNSTSQPHVAFHRSAK